ncbi:RRQRL motif-containing zinc-binding protein [Streptomyces sp. NPDC058202]|uniref:RRQRL motif-containing zinc-binding protein n=1 Tax=Streptomyces sp. NPDC058202 TaxID=3346380 RepID=UPI0036E5AC24
MAGVEGGLVDVDPYDDGSFPTFGWLQGINARAVLAAVRGEGPVPKTGLATRRHLRALGLRPGGQKPLAALEWRGGRRMAHFYRIELALPKRTPTLAQEAALDRAMAARQTCPKCARRYHYCLPLRTQGCCTACDTGTEPTPCTFVPPARHELAT